MQLVGVLLGSVALLVAIGVLARVRLRLELTARGESDGSWLAAAGAELGPLALTGVAARGIGPKLELHAIGRRFDVTRLARKRAPEPARQQRTAAESTSIFEGSADVVAFALEERRRFAVEELRIEVAFGFRDIALTGKIVGALYALSGVLPARVSLLQNPRWDGRESWELNARGTLGLWPGLVLCEVLCYMFRRAARRRFPRAPRAAGATAP